MPLAPVLPRPQTGPNALRQQTKIISAPRCNECVHHPIPLSRCVTVGVRARRLRALPCVRCTLSVQARAAPPRHASQQPAKPERRNTRPACPRLLQPREGTHAALPAAMHTRTQTPMPLARISRVCTTHPGPRRHLFNTVGAAAAASSRTHRRSAQAMQLPRRLRLQPAVQCGAAAGRAAVCTRLSYSFEHSARAAASASCRACAASMAACCCCSAASHSSLAFHMWLAT